MEDITRELLKMYPNRIIERLRTMNANLYERCRRMAKEKGMSLCEFLEECGFRYESGSNARDRQVIRRKLLECYPDKVIVNFRTNHKNLYDLCRHAAKKEGMKVNEFCRKLGFEYRYEGKVRTNAIKNKLTQYYPNGIITGLCQKDKRLYYVIRYKAAKANKSVENYLRDLGFKYNKNDKYCIEAMKEIDSKLLKYYPDRKVYQLYANHKALYEKVKKVARHYNTTIEELLKELGFTIV